MGHHDLKAPGLAGLPAVLLQVVGGGGDQVGGIVDDVAPSVAIAVHGKALEGGRHELGRAEGAGPGAAHLLGPEIAAVEDLQRGEEFVLEISLAAADAGERRGRLQHAAVAHLRRVIGLDAPDRGDDVAIDAGGLFGGIELRLVLGEHLAALGEAVVVHENVEIVPDRLGELRLRVHQVHDAQVGREPCGEALKIFLGDVAACGIGPHPRNAIVEIGGALADRGRRHQRMAGSAVLAAPGLRAAGTWRGLRGSRVRAGENTAEQVRQAVLRLCLRASRQQQGSRNQRHAGHGSSTFCQSCH
ncbi:hypothetical protein ABIF50_009828 [Bradyrhizobium diazoefficiens]